MDLLAANDAVARHNRALFQRHGVYVVNVMSGPGAGKTTLLEATVDALRARYRIGVIEGDLHTDVDAARLRARGVPAIQINTEGACHLTAEGVHTRLGELDLGALDLLFVENVGNLVCPAEFDLGEQDRVMLLSVTEGDDKPLKYPLMFHKATALLITKTDLMDPSRFDLQQATQASRAYNKDLSVIPLSAVTGVGMADWVAWLEPRCRAVDRGARGKWAS
jgi:hydrogenase nickel incorporation protein HypB